MRQESHRVYWQQRGGTLPGESKEKLVTSSAAIRISEAARAQDVTQLLRQTLSLPFPINASEQDHDSLVLVGTLHSLDPVVRFEHAEKSWSSSSEPFHVVHSLLPDKCPLVVRDQMVEYLQTHFHSKDKRSHQLQWFFVPGTEPCGNIPNCIDLDGYCTSMEEHDVDSDSDSEESSNELAGDQKDENKKVPWWKIDDSTSSRSSSQTAQECASETVVVARERRRLAQLSACRSALDHHCVSGYLLKRSQRDVHVWKRVHCVLTDDHLWYVSRIYDNVKIARHGRIALTRSLLVEPECSPLYRIPFAFDLVSAGGTSHVFRAPTRSLQMRWIACLRERIVQCHDNRLMEHAELIVGDETMARNKRLAQVALSQTLLKGVSENKSSANTLMNVARFGMEVANYRERCRHLQAVLPARTTVVAVSSSGGRAQHQQPQDVLPTLNGSSLASPTELSSPKIELDPDTQAMVRSAWDGAAVLLAGATQLALALPGGSLGVQDGNKRMARSVETQCRHVDYIITGRFRPLSDYGVFSEDSNERHDHSVDDPPPADLFDHLLRELQSLTVTTDKKEIHATNGKANGDAKHQYREFAHSSGH